MSGSRPGRVVAHPPRVTKYRPESEAAPGGFVNIGFSTLLPLSVRASLMEAAASPRANRAASIDRVIVAAKRLHPKLFQQEK